MKLTKGSFFQFFSLVAVAGLLAFPGCSDNPSNPSSDPITKPGVGSEFIYNEYDTEDDVKVDDTEQTVTMTVMESGLAYNGKSDVYRLHEVYEDGDESDRYVRYESNNDVTFFFSDPEVAAIVDPFWITLPFGSKAGQEATLIDEVSENDEGGFDTLRISWKTSYVGEETVQYMGSSLKVQVINFTISGTIPFPLVGQIQLEAVSTMRFAPSIGFIYSTEDKSDNEGTIRTLISHTLK